jgi:hypothetical protein
MDRLLARLDRRYGRFALENLAVYLVGGMILVFVLAALKPGFAQLLTFSPGAVQHGQYWRLVTYLFIPPRTRFDLQPLTILWFFFTMQIAWMIVASLESEWGAFKLNVYYLLGMLGTTAAGFLVGGEETNFFLNLSLIFAFATIFPDFEILLFFIVPVKMKWLGWIAFGYVCLELAVEDWTVRAGIAAALGNYVLFFWPDIRRILGGGSRVRARQLSTRPSSVPPPRPALEGRACAMCGAREGDGADIRVCSCEKCKAATGGQARTLCLEHARNH